MQLAFYGHNMAVADITYKNVAVRQDTVGFRSVWTDLIKTR